MRSFRSSLGDNVYSASRLGSLVCPRRYYYSYERGLEFKKAAPRLIAGQAIHQGLYVWYSSALDDEQGGLMAAHKVWDAGNVSTQADIRWLNWEHIELVLRGYFEYWSEHETFTPIDNRGNLQVSPEAPLVRRFAEFSYGGRLDLPARDNTEAIYVFDHKSTTGNMGDYYFAQYKVSNQLRGYAALLEKVLGQSVAGVIVNGIYMGKYAATRKPDSMFQRRIYSFTPALLEEWEQNVEQKIAEVEWRRANNYWPQTTSNRICSGCDFNRICTASPRVRETVIARNYQVKAL